MMIQAKIVKRKMAGINTESAASNRILIEVGAGELIDKLTILHIKHERFADAVKRANVARELLSLEAARSNLVCEFPAVAALEVELRAINEVLWKVEDAIRECEAHNDFGPSFVELARAVYKNNDTRAELKRKINLLCGARIIEEKSYNPDPGQAKR